uniref:Uncharacterized protein n=1 Tax=Anguilla anguilla TaxID=7936 RepID=A0A0E9PNW6_ANGAN
MGIRIGEFGAHNCSVALATTTTTTYFKTMFFGTNLNLPEPAPCCQKLSFRFQRSLL